MSIQCDYILLLLMCYGLFKVHDAILLLLYGLAVTVFYIMLLIAAVENSWLANIVC